MSYFVARDSLTESLTQETLPLTSDNIFSEIQRDLLRSVLISSLMAHDTFVRDWALDGESETDRIVRYLAAIQRKYDTTSAFFVSERTRRYHHPSGVVKRVSPDDPGDAWYFRVRELDRPYEINVDHDTANPEQLNIFVNYRVFDYQGDYLGAIGVGLSVDNVTRLIESYQQRYGRTIYFTDRVGAVTLQGRAFNGPDNLHDRLQRDGAAARILANPSATLTVPGRGGEPTRYINSRLIPELGWHLIVEQDGAPGQARLRDTLLLNSAVAVGITVLVLILVQLNTRRYQRRLEHLATRGELTDTANRAGFEMIYEETVRAAQRNGEPIALLAMDIDHFKQLNDTYGHHTYGHHVGDAVIREFAVMARDHVRRSDTLCRWGGDEFLLLLSGSATGSARRIADTLVDAARGHSVPVGTERVRFSISIGVAELRPGESLESLVRRADAALYTPKHQGRSQATTA